MFHQFIHQMAKVFCFSLGGISDWIDVFQQLMSTVDDLLVVGLQRSAVGRHGRQTETDGGERRLIETMNAHVDLLNGIVALLVARRCIPAVKYKSFLSILQVSNARKSIG